MTADASRSAPWVGDVVLALAVAVLLSAVLTVSQAAGGLPPSPWAYLVVTGVGALLLARRRAPVVVLALSVLGTFVYYSLELPAIGVALPVVAALYSAAEQGRTRWAVAGGAVMFLVALVFRLRDDPQPLGTLLGTDAATNLGLLAAAIALGSAVRSHRVRSEQQAEIGRLRAQQDRREEHERLSRELHDTVGHALSVISLHTGVAADAVGHDDAAARAALGQVRAQTTDTLRELRAMVRLLRTAEGEEQEGRRQVRTLAEVPALLEPARAAGVEIRRRIEVEAGQLSPAVDAAAYRLVQEAVTNTLRHARARTLEVTAHLEGEQLLLVIADDGHGAGPAAQDGHGIAGMRERARLLGGELDIDSPATGGWTVTARLPARLTTKEDP
ncbi:two-component sensor histidine kinase [Brachybacterium ginsengisoli]|uniref:histidine kinase n=1 Tax=Brachybacterium ginsengisoli TaxID=1331682 RepID=A0A291GZX3_9MICO|nr:sensor histidine kinase [Brachybacterium ginsengisoli]ATG55771.1 two-component sensor histidine kinase [Brachybacterium ginsengisoli]